MWHTDAHTHTHTERKRQTDRPTHPHCIRTLRGVSVHACQLVAPQALQWLPPAVAVVAHAEVAPLLHDESRAVMALAAHTLACLGPEAVDYD